MDVALMVFYCLIVLSFLVFIHEGGHYLAARIFGIRVTEFMLGLPGPNIGFTKWGTKFGITPLLLGGYARVCGMEPGPEKPYLKEALASLYRRGTANMEDVAFDCGISDDEAYEALEELTEWGSCKGPKKSDEFNTYYAPAIDPSKRELARGAQAYELGQPREVADPDALIASERAQQYRSLPFWKRSVILVAGVAMNLLFCLVAFVAIYSIVGVDVTNAAGVAEHVHVAPQRAIMAGFTYIAMVVQAVIGLFNPATAAETMSNSTSVVGIAVASKTYAEAGLLEFVFFMALISVSLGIMNLLPIPPLDGGRFVIEVFQKVTGREVSVKTLNGLSAAGMAFFLIFFMIMVNQDIQRFVFGNW